MWRPIVWKPIIGLLVALLLSGCADLAVDAKRVTVDDGVKYIDQNHERRRAIRQMKYSIEDEIVARWLDRARIAVQSGDVDGAKVYFEEAYKVLHAAYPSLATVELMREGIYDYGEFRRSLWGLEDEERERGTLRDMNFMEDPNSAVVE